MLSEEQKTIILKTIKHKRLAIISGVMLAITIALGFATRTFSLDMDYGDIVNVNMMSILAETLILALALGIHLAIYSNLKNDAAWDFIGTRDLDGKIDYKKLLADNNMKAKLPIIRIILLSIVFLTNIIAINPVKLATFSLMNNLDKLEAKGEEDGYYIVRYDYPTDIDGVNYCIHFAPDQSQIYRTDFSLTYTEKSKLDSVRYSYQYDNNLSEEENLEKANEQFQIFKEELESLIDEGLVEDEWGTKYCSIDKEFITNFNNQDDKEYYSESDSHYDEGYLIIYSRYFYEGDEAPNLTISVMYY